ncbi:unnamed protein product [Plutella xylostella]|uniref:(diamondback moth) hypothetical protein n=1 Tax=Plutella xylostella TaxID=51655 RepID=A0A8S4GDG0_PLUXY|nr:unnamed protein product [Plutella xylostella]
MNLRKWSGNHPSLLENLNKDQIAPKNNFNFKNDETQKTLGIEWNPENDSFHFRWTLEEGPITKLTKRKLLSEISKLYDPLGWLSPVTVSAKLLFQSLWISKIGWDEQVPEDAYQEWAKLRSEIYVIKHFKLMRWMGNCQQRIELLGFCDASEKAFACVLYSRVQDEDGRYEISLLAARTRVAPKAQKTTLPRLELSGALLLTKLIEKAQEALTNYTLSVTAWYDSQVVLAWIKGDTSKWETFQSATDI